MLEAQQRPEQQAPVGPALEMVLDEWAHAVGIEELVDGCVTVEQLAAYVVDRVAAEPARVRASEALLDLSGDRLWHVALHDLAQQELAVARPLEVTLRLRARLVLVEANDGRQVAELELYRNLL